MGLSQLDVITRQLEQLLTSQQQLQTQFVTVQTEIAATRKGVRGLADQKYFQHNHRDGGRVREHERDYDRHNTHSLPRHKERSFRHNKVDTSTYDGYDRHNSYSLPRHRERLFRNNEVDAPTYDGRLDSEILTQWTALK